MTTDKFMKIDHIGIATRELKEATAVWRDALGLRVEFTDDIAEQGVRIAMLPIGEAHIELLEPLTQESPVGKFLEKRGPVIHPSRSGRRHSGGVSDN